jgi:hypothetical protein
MPRGGQQYGGKVTVTYLESYDSWKVRNSGNSSLGPDSYVDTKQKAIGQARALAQRYGAKLVVEKQNGAESYTRDYS